MISVDEIHVGTSRRAEQNSISRRLPAGRVGGGIALAEIGFDFHNPACQPLAPLASNQNFAQ